MSLAYRLREEVIVPANAITHGWAGEAGTICKRWAAATEAFPLVHAFWKINAATCASIQRQTAPYDRPAWGIQGVTPVTLPNTSRHNAFVNVTHFDRPENDNGPVVLIFAPMSGHFATLLRQTAKDIIGQGCNTFITEHEDASRVPLKAGDFGFEDCIEFYMDAIRAVKEKTGRDVHVMAVCQPGPALAAALAIMEKNNDIAMPRTATFMGSPIDVSQFETAPITFANEHDMAWFRQHAIHTVPSTREGEGREVYPGLQQLTAFMSMKAQDHARTAQDHFHNLIKGDDGAIEKQRAFDAEFFSVADLPVTFYLETVERVFRQRQLPRGLMTYRGGKIDLNVISRTPILTVEGSADDITGKDQCHSLGDLCGALSSDMKRQVTAEGVGHYGIFSGTTGWRNQVLPVFMRQVHDYDGKPRSFVPKKMLAFPSADIKFSA